MKKSVSSQAGRTKRGMTGLAFGLAVASLLLPAGAPAGGETQIRFAGQEYPQPESAGLVTAIPRGWGVAGLSFRLVCALPPSSLQVILHVPDAGREWSFALAVPAPGEWRAFDVPLDYSAGWTCGPCASPALFARDMAGVDRVELVLVRNGSCAEQTFTVADVAVRTVELDADRDRIPDGWEHRFGLDPGVDDAAADADGDGRSNYDEYIADTNPRDGKSRLAITAIRVSNAAVQVSWSGGRDAVQVVEKTVPGMAGWFAVETVQPPAPATNAVSDRPGAGGFYRIRAFRTPPDS